MTAITVFILKLLIYSHAIRESFGTQIVYLGDFAGHVVSLQKNSEPVPHEFRENDKTTCSNSLN
jgi:hypothetical protein